MGIKEFSDGFDTLLNSYSVSADFGEETSRQTVALDEYEKSVFLTMAQEELVLSIYKGQNAFGESFESTEEIRRYLSSLVSTAALTPITNSNGMVLGISSNSKFFTLPEDLWFITMESVKVSDSRCKDKNTLKVYPVKQDEYQNIKDNPFRGANSRRALRLDLSDGQVEIISKYNVTEYMVRYLKKLSPIILTDLPDGMKIDGEYEAMGCKLHEALHQKILHYAVMNALQSKGYNITKDNKVS